jgi:hypothetical protein
MAQFTPGSGQLPAGLHRGRRGPRRGLGRLGRADSAIGDRIQLSARSVSSPTRSAWKRASSGCAGNALLVKVNQSHPDRDPGRGGAGAQQRYRTMMSHRTRRDRGHTIATWPWRWAAAISRQCPGPQRAVAKYNHLLAHRGSPRRRRPTPRPVDPPVPRLRASSFESCPTRTAHQRRRGPLRPVRRPLVRAVRVGSAKRGSRGRSRAGRPGRARVRRPTCRGQPPYTVARAIRRRPPTKPTSYPTTDRVGPRDAPPSWRRCLCSDPDHPGPVRPIVRAARRMNQLKMVEEL